MNKEEMLLLDAGEIIDDMVSEIVMGWHKQDDKYGTDWVNSENRYQHIRPRYDGQYEDDEDFNLIRWHPSESIMWAMDVLEEVKDDIFGIYWENVPGKKEWTVALKPEDSHSGGTPIDAEELPLAICRAALYLKMK